MTKGFLRRCGVAGLALLITLDAVLCTLWLVPLYVCGLADQPTGRQLISGYVGKAAYNGHKWGQRVAKLIDSLFGKDHCYRAFRRGYSE